MSELVDGFTVQEAAAALGVSRDRVQRMIMDELLTAERVGNRWVIPRHEVFRATRIPRLTGRPFTPDNCWLIIDDLASARRPLSWLLENWHRLGNRAHHRTGRVLPELIDDLFDDIEIVIGGAHAAAVAGVPVRAGTAPIDIYVDNIGSPRLTKRIGLQAITSNPNVTVHTVAPHQWNQLRDQRTVNLVVAYLDLVEAGDRAAAEVSRYLRGHQ